jgi:hypothetical protein
MTNEQEVQIGEIQRRLDLLEARKCVPGPRGPAGNVDAAVVQVEAAAKRIVIDRLDSYAQQTEAIAARVQQQADNTHGNFRSEFQNTVNSTAKRPSEIRLKMKSLRSF